jgi:hypothetical protein
MLERLVLELRPLGDWSDHDEVAALGAFVAAADEEVIVDLANLIGQRHRGLVGVVIHHVRRVAVEQRGARLGREAQRVNQLTPLAPAIVALALGLTFRRSLERLSVPVSEKPVLVEHVGEWRIAPVARSKA